jgi:phosphohistidine phosphatase
MRSVSRNLLIAPDRSTEAMKLLIVRHAPAGDRAVYAKTGKPDTLRPLTPKGRKKMTKAARGLRRILPSIDVIATSRLKRALQTGEILNRAFRDARSIEIEALAPGGKSEDVLRKIQALKKIETLALVGHEPDLSSLAVYLLAGQGRFKLEMKKGAACLLSFEGPPRAGAGTLLWALAPGHLRKLAG